MRGFEGSIGNFELRLSSSAGSGAMPIGDSIMYGDIMLGSITGSESASYVFFGSEGEFIDVTVDPTSEEFDLILDVLNSNGRSILASGSVDDSFGAESVRLIRLPESGFYSIIVTGFNSSFGEFILSLDTSIINSGDEIYGYLNEDGPIRYRYYGLLGETIVITLQTDENVDGIIRILDQNNNVLTRVDSRFSGETERLTYTFNDDNIFYVEVSDYHAGQGEFILFVNEG